MYFCGCFWPFLYFWSWIMEVLWVPKLLGHWLHFAWKTVCLQILAIFSFFFFYKGLMLLTSATCYLSKKLLVKKWIMWLKPDVERVWVVGECLQTNLRPSWNLLVTTTTCQWPKEAFFAVSLQLVLQQQPPTSSNHFL